MRPLVVLGATGSIGRQALEVAAGIGMNVEAVSAHSPSAELAGLARRLGVEAVAAGGTEAERQEFAGLLSVPVSFGSEAVAELASRPGRVVLNGIVGAAGLPPTLAALEAGNRVALANKESLVAGGPLVLDALARQGGELLPVDSEHSALHQCLAAEHPDDVARIVLTASGGPFRGRDRESLREVSPEEALRHPTWEMGGRITIDSATLMNKGLEVIEAHLLFGVSLDRISVVVHPQSIVHSAVEFVDGALKAHVGHPDMRVPIQYALTYPRRAPNPGQPFSLAGTTLRFEEPDRSAFPALDLAYRVGEMGGAAPAALNAADEVAVAAFLEGRIGFLDVVSVV
ncbi:MAG: 1-deoxy-D-xylulose-5-phosphate reductoisomerase, partial [Actinomycetota bacterium]